MRDVGTLVWVVLVVIGVVSSMVSTIRKQAQSNQAQVQRPPRRPSAVAWRPVAPQPAQPLPVPPPVPPPPAPAPERPPVAAPQPSPAAHPAEAPRAKRAPFFAGKRQLVRAVIAAEVLGKPLGLRDEQSPR